MSVQSALDQVVAELQRARREFAPFKNGHEAYGVLMEEVRELESAIFMRYGPERDAQILAEATQVAAMATRILVDLADGASGGFIGHRTP
jgi:hypothetical protein